MRILICMLYIFYTGACFALSTIDSLSKEGELSVSFKELDNNRVMKNRIIYILPVCDNIISQVSKEQIKRWNRSLDSRISDRMCNESSSSEMVLTNLAQEWWFDNRNKIKEDDEAAILEACLFIRRFVDNRCLPPVKLLQGVNNRLTQRVIHRQNMVGYNALVIANNK